ncbi:MAG: aldehyde dehydrogenase family protein [Bacteroidia bacterium]
MKNAISLAPNSATSEDISRIFALQQAYTVKAAGKSLSERKARIRAIRDYILAHQEEIKVALFLDFHKTESEVIISELTPIKVEANFVLQNLGKWLKPRKTAVAPEMLGTSSRIHRVPKGNVLIIGPFNYPWFLTIKPIIWAVAAGNTVMVKPSELVPHTSALIRKMLESIFPPEELFVVEGNPEVVTALLRLPFQHIYFTGSPRVGKIVMEAASRHLASVTLELGGKSPVVIDETADIKSAASHIAWGKTLNNGQTCISPDYILIHHSRKAAFIEAFRAAISQMFDPQGKGIQQSPSYSRLVNARQFERVTHLLEDAVEKGAKLETGGMTDASDNFIAPTLLSGVTEDMEIMHEEIFGPLLPILTYDRTEDIPALISPRRHPLVLYIFSRNQQMIDFLLDQVPSGDAVINDVLIHFGNKYTPVGGIGNSGIGKSGGHAGFLEFTHERTVIRRVFAGFDPVFPPYEGRAGKLLKLLLKWI